MAPVRTSSAPSLPPTDSWFCRALSRIGRCDVVPLYEQLPQALGARRRLPRLARRFLRPPDSLRRTRRSSTAVIIAQADRAAPCRPPPPGPARGFASNPPSPPRAAPGRPASGSGPAAGPRASEPVSGLRGARGPLSQEPAPQKNLARVSPLQGQNRATIGMRDPHDLIPRRSFRIPFPPVPPGKVLQRRLPGLARSAPGESDPWPMSRSGHCRS